jgi:hypothetical protein
MLPTRGASEIATAPGDWRDRGPCTECRCDTAETRCFASYRSDAVTPALSCLLLCCIAHIKEPRPFGNNWNGSKRTRCTLTLDAMAGRPVRPSTGAPSAKICAGDLCESNFRSCTPEAVAGTSAFNLRNYIRSRMGRLPGMSERKLCSRHGAEPCNSGPKGLHTTAPV